MVREGAWRGILAEIERTATARGRRLTGCGWVEGTRLHERALRAGRSVRRAVMTAAFAAAGDDRRRQLREALVAAGCELRVAPDEALCALTEGRSAEIAGLVELPEPASIESLVVPAATVLVAWEVEDPGNVGALARTALASGSTGFVTVGVSDPFHPRAIRTSRGSVFKLSWTPLQNAGAMQALRGFQSIGAVTAGGTAPGAMPHSSKPRALLMGGEAFGLPAAVVEQLDHRVTIPMSAEADSYSVNAAAAILLWALRSSPDASP